MKVDISTLNDLEISVYNYIVSNRDKVIYMTIRELASENHVSTTTILRLVKKLGFEGFSEFKSNLKIDNKKEKFKYKENNILEELLVRLRDTDLKKQINDAVELLKNYETIFFAGVGNSAHIAAYGGRFFSNYGKIAVVIDTLYYPLTAESISEAIAIIISVSGESNDIVRIAKTLKGRGVKIISITNSKTSSLSKISDLNIAYYMERDSYYSDEAEELSYRDCTSQIPAMYIVEEIGRKLDK